MASGGPPGERRLELSLGEQIEVLEEKDSTQGQQEQQHRRALCLDDWETLRCVGVGEIGRGGQSG